MVILDLAVAHVYLGNAKEILYFHRHFQIISNEKKTFQIRFLPESIWRSPPFLHR